MKNYQFRINWRGKLILQCQDYNRDKWGDKYYYWRDATVSDLKTYYQQLYEHPTNPRHHSQTTCLGKDWAGADG